MTDIATRVARGVALLDEQKPGWVGLIDLSAFDIGSTDRCILGQLYPVGHDDKVWVSGFDKGCDVLLPCCDYFGDDELCAGQCGGAEYGFDTTNGCETAREEYPALTAEWVRVIEVLRQRNQVQVTEVEEPVQV